MKPPSKPILIAGGVALAVGAIWYIKKTEKPQDEFLPVEGPKTYASSQEASGNFGGFGGGGAPSSGTAPGTTTVPPKDPLEGLTAEQVTSYYWGQGEPRFTEKNFPRPPSKVSKEPHPPRVQL